MNHASFHLPLHRYLAAFTCQAVKTQGLSLKDILPPPAMLQQLMIHPLKVQVSGEGKKGVNNIMGVVGLAGNVKSFE